MGTSSDPMATPSFTKLFSSITASTIWCRPNHVRIVWITMLAMANRDGEVLASIPGLADISRVPLADCEAAIKELSSPDKYSRTKAKDGRRIEEIDGGWRLVNYAHYRAMRDAEATKESKRKWWAENRSLEATRKTRTDSTQAEAEAEAYIKPKPKALGIEDRRRMLVEQAKALAKSKRA